MRTAAALNALGSLKTSLHSGLPRLNTPGVSVLAGGTARISGYPDASHQLLL